VFSALGAECGQTSIEIDFSEDDVYRLTYKTPLSDKSSGTILSEKIN